MQERFCPHCKSTRIMKHAGTKRFLPDISTRHLLLVSASPPTHQK
uniref:Uncharacterized protein n=1 Tax=Rhizophora mucronata TaxID=61149 RepID=A0A2P2QU53_RHIMU